MNKNICKTGWTSGLSVRASNALIKRDEIDRGAYGEWKSKDDIIESLKKNGANALRRVPNCGRQTYLEILSWLGVTESDFPK